MLKVVWTPGMTFRPHNHAMWAAIGIYTGGEDNEFFRREGGGLTPSGGRSLHVGDTVLLGGDVIHAVTNPTKEHAGAIHIYGGDLFGAVRSEWDPETFEEQQYDVPAAIQYFEDQNRLFESPTGAPERTATRSTMRTIVTGASGFVGSNIAKVLEDRHGDTVIGESRRHDRPRRCARPRRGVPT